jgi:hypothetical protein
MTPVKCSVLITGNSAIGMAITVASTSVRKAPVSTGLLPMKRQPG